MAADRRLNPISSLKQTAERVVCDTGHVDHPRTSAGLTDARRTELAYNRTQANTLPSADEMVLFDASLADRLKASGAVELRKQVMRTRTLRDKSSDLPQRQKIATRGRAGTLGGAPTGHPAQAKGPTGKALVQLLPSATTPPQRGTPALPPRSAKAPAVAPMAGKRTGPGSDSARAMAKTSKLQNKGSLAIQGHVSVVGRHNQAKLDGRS